MLVKLFVPGLCLTMLLVGCGEADLQNQNGPGSLPEDPNLSKSLSLKGVFESPAQLQIRELAPSRQIQLQGEIRIEATGEDAGLVERLDPAGAEAIWQAPGTMGCKLTQVHFARSGTKPLRYSFLFWGWDKRGAPQCERLLTNVREEGFALVLYKVRLRGGGAVGQVQISVAPSH